METSQEAIIAEKTAVHQDGNANGFYQGSGGGDNLRTGFPKWIQYVV